MKKRILATIMAIMMCASFAACGDDSSVEEDIYNETMKRAEEMKEVGKKSIEESKKKEADREKALKDNKTTLKNATLSFPTADLEITAYTIGPDKYMDDTDNIYLYITYTNKYDSDINFNFVPLNLYQGGAMLERTSVENMEYNTLIQPGASNDIELAWTLRDDKNDIDMIISYDDENGDAQEAKYTLKLK